MKDVLHTVKHVKWNWVTHIASLKDGRWTKCYLIGGYWRRTGKGGLNQLDGNKRSAQLREPTEKDQRKITEAGIPWERTVLNKGLVSQNMFRSKCFFSDFILKLIQIFGQSRSLSFFGSFIIIVDLIKAGIVFIITQSMQSRRGSTSGECGLCTPDVP